jgi:hypothetical protein
MRDPVNIDELLASAQRGSGEWLFWSAVADIIAAINLPHDSVNGFACILALELAEVYLRDGREIGSPEGEGGIENLCRVVAVMFASVNPDPIWWKSQYPSKMTDPLVRAAAREINRKIPALSIVKKYRPWLD